MLSRRSLIASTAALAAGCSTLGPPPPAPSVPQGTALNVAASTKWNLWFGDPFFERPEDKYLRAAATLEADRENPYGPTRGGYSLAVRFFEDLYPQYEAPKTAEEAEAAQAAVLDAAAALLEDLEADLVTVWQPDAGWLGQHGLLLPLDRFSGPKGAALDQEFFPSVLDQFRRGGALYALPIGALPLMLHYDEGYFAARGVLPVDASWDWDDLVENAVKLTTHKEDGMVARWGLIAHREWVWWALWQNGVEAVDPDTLQCRLQEPAAIEALQFVHDLIHTHRVSPPLSWRDLWELNLVGRSPPAMLYEYSPSILSRTGFRTAALPRGKAYAVPVRASFGLAIAARTHQPEAAYTALRGLTHAMQEEVAIPAGRAALARLAEFRTDLHPAEVAAIQHSLEHGRAEPQPGLHVSQLVAMHEVMESLGRGDDVAAMVNGACSLVREYQQAGSPPIWGRAVQRTPHPFSDDREPA